MPRKENKDLVVVDGEIADTATGEIIDETAPLVQLPAATPASGGAAMNKRELAILRAPTPAEIVLKRPDGFWYVEQVQYRNRLHMAFGVGGWFWRQVGSVQVYKTTRWNEKKGADIPVTYVTLQGELYRWRNGQAQYLAVGYGKAEYFDHQNPADAMESAKSDSITRGCKDLGMFSELWEKGYRPGDRSHQEQDPARGREPERETPSARATPPPQDEKPKPSGYDTHHNKAKEALGFVTQEQKKQFMALVSRFDPQDATSVAAVAWYNKQEERKWRVDKGTAFDLLDKMNAKLESLAPPSRPDDDLPF